MMPISYFLNDINMNNAKLPQFHISLSHYRTVKFPTLSVVFHKYPWCFHQFNAVQFNSLRNQRNKFIPDAQHEIFNRAHLIPHKIHIKVQVPVVQLFNDRVFNDPAQQFGINNKAGIRVGKSLYRDKQFKIMAMPVLIGAFAKDFIILFTAPGWVIELVRSIKMFHPR